MKNLNLKKQQKELKEKLEKILEISFAYCRDENLKISQDSARINDLAHQCLKAAERLDIS